MKLAGINLTDGSYRNCVEINCRYNRQKTLGPNGYSVVLGVFPTPGGYYFATNDVYNKLSSLLFETLEDAVAYAQREGLFRSEEEVESELAFENAVKEINEHSTGNAYLTTQDFIMQNGGHEPGKLCFAAVIWCGAVPVSEDFDTLEDAKDYGIQNGILNY